MPSTSVDKKLGVSPPFAILGRSCRARDAKRVARRQRRIESNHPDRGSDVAIGRHREHDRQRIIDAAHAITHVRRV